MPSTAARAVLRPTRGALRRNVAPGRRHASNEASSSSASSSTTSQATEKAKETASNISSKASEGLSRVKSSAGPALNKAGEAAKDAASRASNQAGGIVSRVTSIVPPIVYYSKVALELSKIVFRGQKMQPPTTAQFQSYFQPALNAVRNPARLVSQNASLMNPNNAVNYVRGLTARQLASGGVIVAELIGFFTVGEMIGRLKIVGYRGKIEHEHH